MTFSVNGIKQEKNEKTTIEMVICVNDALLARKILEDHTILILSLKEFPGDPKSFGDIYFSINQNFQKIDIVTKYTDIQKACSFFSFMGFAPLNSLTTTLYISDHFFTMPYSFNVQFSASIDWMIALSDCVCPYSKVSLSSPFASFRKNDEHPFFQR